MQDMMLVHVLQTWNVVWLMINFLFDHTCTYISMCYNGFDSARQLHGNNYKLFQEYLSHKPSLA